MPSDSKTPAHLPDTRWSLVGRAASTDPGTRRLALTELLEAYHGGLCSFLVRTRRLTQESAEDVVQAFVADKVLAQDFVRQADQGRGRFRSFVCKALSNYAATRQAQDRRAQGAPLEPETAAHLSSEETTDLFDLEWVHMVVRDALALFEADCRARDRMDRWEIFSMRLVTPLLEDTEPVPYAEVVQQLGLDSPRKAINLLANAKRLFEEVHLPRAVGRYASDSKSIEAELEELRRIVWR